MRPDEVGQKVDSGADARVPRIAPAWASVFAALPACFLMPGTALALPMSGAADPGELVVLAAVTSGAIALAIAAGLWALAEQRASARLRRSLKLIGARTRAAVGERDALIKAGGEPLIVWGRDGTAPYSYGGADVLLDSCLQGPDATAFSSVLDGLSDRGAPFSLTVHDKEERKIVARGRAVGGMAAVWFEEPVEAAASTDFRAILDALPNPVWLRDKGLALTWGNYAFLRDAGAADINEARANQVALDKSERDLAASARAQNLTIETKQFAVVGGKRRALAFTQVPLGDAGVIGTAIDVTEVASAEARLQQHADAHADTLDKLATPVAIFGQDQKLTFYNRAFAKLWELPESWLDTHPSDGELLDRLREGRKLPEQRDYQAWKRERLALYRQENPGEDVWHLPSGKTLRVIAQHHPLGGLTFLYEDVSERLALESSYNTLIKVQSATLDTMREGVAVFGPDGRLKLFNAAFAHLWALGEKDLAGEPHIRAIALAASAKLGTSPVWEELIQSIVSGAAAKREFADIQRGDGTILSLGLAPLPNGATLATFADVTDRSRVEGALRERNEALETADRLKSDFIKHASYELRTPLNTITGFSEHLASGAAGELNERQSEYVQAILSGSNALKNLVNDILDLALVESGAVRLDLERIELCEFLGEIAAHAREWAVKVGLLLELDCPPGTGLFLGDVRRLRQIIFNLLSNAFKYTPRGGVITLTGRIVDEDVQISVADNGPGLAPDVKANVFERFSGQTRSGQRAGAGLGLALVNRFVELHSGWVEIESSHGTIVRCHIPRRVHGNPAPEDNRKTA